MTIRLTNMGEPRLVMVLKDDMSNIDSIMQVLQLAGFDYISTSELNGEVPYWFVSESGSSPGITCCGLSHAGYARRFDTSSEPIDVHDDGYDAFMSEAFKKFIDRLRAAVSDGKVGIHNA